MKKEILRMEKASIGDYEPYAVDEFSLHIFEGEIVVLIGMSGSGKTMLQRYFQGSEVLRNGRVILKNKEYHKGASFGGTTDVICIGQKSTLIPNLSIMENIFVVTNKRGRGFFLNKKNMEYRARVLLSRYAPGLDPKEKVKNLSPVQMRMVELLRAIENEVPLVIVDDGFSPYGLGEITALSMLLERMKEIGISILYECHQFDFMMGFYDRMVVMRKGRNIRTFYPNDYQENIIKELMLGTETPEPFARTSCRKDDVIFEIKDLKVKQIEKPLNLTIKKGEIVGICDTENISNMEVIGSIIGQNEFETGEFYLNGTRYIPKSLDDAVKKNIGYLPRNMTYVSLVDSMSFQDNLFLPVMKKTSKFGMFNDETVLHFLEKQYAHDVGIKKEDKHLPVRNFDAYVQNSVLMTRWVLFKPTLFVCEEPFANADFMMKNILYRALDEMAQQGTAILIASANRAELREICDKVYMKNSFL